MHGNFWLFLTIGVISAGGAMIGRALSRWAEWAISRSEALAQLVMGIGAVGAGVTMSTQSREPVDTSGLRCGCILVVMAGMLIQARLRSARAAP